LAPYRGRFAPSPTGPLHAGSVVAALASWLDARAHGGSWLVRIEDTDKPRCVNGADAFILHQLACLGLQPDEPVQWQSKRTLHYETALKELCAKGHAYGCACSRQDIERALAAAGHARERHAMAVYPGTCRAGLQGTEVRAWRVRVQGMKNWRWLDRRLGPQQQDLETQVGDFVVKRSDGLWAYQLAVVVDDGLQGITHVVRGEDLADNTPRQQHLQHLLGLPRPHYLHTGLVRSHDGQKLSKQTGAQAVDVRNPLQALRAAARVLELDVACDDSAVGQDTAVSRWLELATEAWGQRWCAAAATRGRP
jgi:glutamyl-Q tRNA(Asp) synthetase